MLFLIRGERVGKKRLPCTVPQLTLQPVHGRPAELLLKNNCGWKRQMKTRGAGVGWGWGVGPDRERKIYYIFFSEPMVFQQEEELWDGKESILRLTYRSVSTRMKNVSIKICTVGAQSLRYCIHLQEDQNIQKVRTECLFPIK